MFANHSTEQTEDIELIQQLNRFLSQQPLINNQLLTKQLEELPNFNKAASQTSNIFTKNNIKQQLFASHNFNCSKNINYTAQSQPTPMTKFQFFYKLLDQLIIIDQQIVYLKNIIDRFKERKKCQFIHIFDDTLIFSPWEYITNLDPSPSQQQLQFCDIKLKNQISKCTKLWNHLISSFSQSEAQNIFFDIDFQKKGSIDVFDIICQLQIWTGKSYDMKDVVNLFRRLTNQDELTLNQFIKLFQK